jgi:ABC-type sugar transport system ATPase subunit
LVLASVPEAIRTEHVAKRFDGVVALADVNLRLGKGEVLGLVGDNGAGKSTLIKILTGFLRLDAGKIFVHGLEVDLHSVTRARSFGIDTVYQDLALIPDLPVYANMFLRREIVGRRLGLVPLLRKDEMRRRARDHLHEMGVQIPSVDSEVAKLSGGQRQAIAIARSVYSGAQILLLDEPLAAMGAREARLILELILKLKRRGDVSMIIISHTFAQIFEVCDRINLLRGGQIVFDKQVDGTSVDELTKLVIEEYRLEPAAP